MMPKTLRNTCYVGLWEDALPTTRLLMTREYRPWDGLHTTFECCGWWDHCIV